MNPLVMKRWCLFFVLIVTVVISVAWIWWGVSNERSITNFEECRTAGHSVTESFPAECRMSDGRIFIEGELAKEGLYARCTGTDIPNIAIDTRLDEMEGTVEVRWTDRRDGIERIVVLPYDPASGFAGCSPSAQRVLKRILETGEGRIDASPIQ
jgi:hypothetical protein